MLSSLLLPTRRAHIDFGATFAEIDGLLHGRGLRSTPIDPELAHAHGLFLVEMATKAFAGERIARAVVSHVRAGPVFSSLVVTIHPKPELDAPILLADVRVLPSATTRAYLDACGPGANGEFDVLFRKPLSQTLDAAVASAVRRQRVPEWMNAISSGAGAQVAASPGRGSVLAYALLRYVERYLDGVDRATAAVDASANVVAARKVADVVRTHGRGGKMIARAFGAGFAERYDQLLWNA
ncbi:MAG TPA: hypothetical protein VLM85_23340 [Polyangiaceae bacterium]|nr:hypothetical protein [Polyangiaceae bacterium]